MPFRKKEHKKVEGHECAVLTQTSASFLPPLAEDASWFQRFKRNVKKSTLISEENPQSTEYFRSNTEILRMRKEHVEMHNHIIHPFSKFRMYYEMYMTVALLVIILYMPVSAGFDTNIDRLDKRLNEHWSITGLNMSLKLLCIFDIVMNFMTGYPIRDQRKVVMNARQIAKKYVCSIYFISDFLSSIPEVFYMDYAQTEAGARRDRIFDSFGLLKIFRLPDLFYFATRSAEVLKLRGIGVHFIRGFVVTYIMFHWFACAQYFIPQIRVLTQHRHSFDTRSWVRVTSTDMHSFVGIYIRCLYRASGYILCINFEVLRLVLWEEKTLAILTFVFGKVFVLYYTVMLVTQLLTLRDLETKYFAVISQVKSYMSQKQLPIPMQKRILQYYRYKYNNRYFKEETITGLLSDKLIGEINLSVCNKMVQSVAILAQLPEKQLELIVTSLTAEIYLPNDIIIKAGAVGDCMYFMASGTVAVSTPSGKEVCHLQDGAYFGETSMIFKDKKRSANVIAIEICEVYKLDKKSFKTFFRDNEELLKTLEDVARERLQTTEMYEEMHKKQFLERTYE